MRSAFKASGPTALVAGATTAPSGVQAVGTTPTEQYRIHNAGAVTAHVAYGATAAEALANAVIPTGSGANAKNSFPVPAGAVEVVSAHKDSFWSAITATSTANVFVTPGRGF